MRAILLAGGLGTRLRPLTDSVPKCLVPVRGRPLLDFWLASLFGQGIEKVLVNTHYLPDQVELFVENSPWRNNVVLSRETALLGTAGTVFENRNFFGAEPVLVAHADNLAAFSLQKFRKAYANRPPGVVMTMMTFETDAPSGCGVVEVDGRGVVQQFHEKVANPPGNLANGAIYIMGPEVIERMATCDPPPTDISTGLLPFYTGKMNTFHNTLYLRDIGTASSLAAAENDLEIRPDLFP